MAENVRKCYISNCIFLHYSSSLIVSHSYLRIWVNCCTIIHQVIIQYLTVLKRLTSILNLVLFSSTLPVALHVVVLVSLGPRVAPLVVDMSPSHSCCFGLLNTSSRSARCKHVSVSLLLLWLAQDLNSLCSLQICVHLNLSSFVLLNTSSRSARCRLVSVSIFVALDCSTP